METGKKYVVKGSGSNSFITYWKARQKFWKLLHVLLTLNNLLMTTTHTWTSWAGLKNNTFYNLRQKSFGFSNYFLSIHVVPVTYKPMKVTWFPTTFNYPSDFCHLLLSISCWQQRTSIRKVTSRFWREFSLSCHASHDKWHWRLPNYCNRTL